MAQDKHPPQEPGDENKAVAPSPSDPAPGFLILKMRDGEGAMVSDTIEVRLCNSRHGRADIAIRAPRNVRIRKLTDQP